MEGHLSYNSHSIGLIGKENEILKQQIKLLTGKATSVGWSKILFQALIHLNGQPVGPIALYARPGTPAKVPDTIKLWKSWETDTASTHRGSMWYATWKRYCLLEFTVEYPTKMGVLLPTPGRGGNTQSSLRSCCPASSCT